MRMQRFFERQQQLLLTTLRFQTVKRRYSYEIRTIMLHLYRLFDPGN